MTTGMRLTVGGGIIAAVTAYMAYLGAGSSWQYYLTVDECVADGASLVDRPLRVTGHVLVGSLEIQADRRQATFTLDGTDCQLRAVCSGPLPDNLAEDIDVVVEGRLTDASHLQGDRVLTRCASKYRTDEPGDAMIATEQAAARDRSEVER